LTYINLAKGVAVAAFAFASAANAETLKLGTDQPDGHPYDLGAEIFADLVSTKTNGEVTVKIFPGAQLGDTGEQIEGLKIGTLDMSLAAFSHASQFCPELGLFGAPFLFEDEDHFAAVFDGGVGDTVEAACVDRYGIRLLNTFTSGYRLLFNGKRSVARIEDLEGLKIRVMGGEADAMTWQVFGAIPTPMPYSEVYSALQAGVIDGAENEPASILANRFYEAAPYFANTKHLVLPMGMFISDTVFDKLTESQQQAVVEAANEAATWQRTFMAERNASAIEEMVANYGVTVTDIDPAALGSKGAAIQDKVAERLGLQDLLAEVRAAAK
jgi:tripartite ATP-independent transporter DctP family solute receptor